MKRCSCVVYSLQAGRKDVTRRHESPPTQEHLFTEDGSACEVWVDSDILENSTLNVTLLLPGAIQLWYRDIHIWYIIYWTSLCTHMVLLFLNCSFVTATFMLEAMAAANGTLRYVTRQKQLNVSVPVSKNKLGCSLSWLVMAVAGREGLGDGGRGVEGREGWGGGGKRGSSSPQPKLLIESPLKNTKNQNTYLNVWGVLGMESYDYLITRIR